MRGRGRGVGDALAGVSFDDKNTYRNLRGVFSAWEAVLIESAYEGRVCVPFGLSLHYVVPPDSVYSAAGLYAGVPRGARRLKLVMWNVIRNGGRLDPHDDRRTPPPKKPKADRAK